jgi:hypothetical protein
VYSGCPKPRKKLISDRIYYKIRKSTKRECLLNLLNWSGHEEKNNYPYKEAISIKHLCTASTMGQTITEISKGNFWDILRVILGYEGNVWDGNLWLWNHTLVHIPPKERGLVTVRSNP